MKTAFVHAHYRASPRLEAISQRINLDNQSASRRYHPGDIIEFEDIDKARTKTHGVVVSSWDYVWDRRPEGIAMDVKTADGKIHTIRPGMDKARLLKRPTRVARAHARGY
jgi:hypothetical protein